MGDFEHDNHEDRLMSSLQRMMDTEQFADVTICCADGYKLRAHKVVLSYCSPYLQTLFLGHPRGADDSITIILQGVGHEDVERVLQFVYTGAAVVPGHSMDGFMTTAGALGIGPLLDPRRHMDTFTTRPPPPPPPSRYHRPCTPPPAYDPPPSRIRQLPRTTGILTPSPWAQNSRPPCAAPKYPALRTTHDPAPRTVHDLAPRIVHELATGTAQDSDTGTAQDLTPRTARNSKTGQSPITTAVQVSGCSSIQLPFVTPHLRLLLHRPIQWS
uniref:Protein tramtrack, alpha isoform n=1 Tax=Sipha flava TaxID=143950 RepID=A0A2S2QTS0_9HEMI